MKVCDICKTRNPLYDDHAVINDNGETKKIELCPSCYRELKARENQARHRAYLETIEAVTGKRPRREACIPKTEVYPDSLAMCVGSNITLSRTTQVKNVLSIIRRNQLRRKEGR